MLNCHHVTGGIKGIREAGLHAKHTQRFHSPIFPVIQHLVFTGLIGLHRLDVHTWWW